MAKKCENEKRFKLKANKKKTEEEAYYMAVKHKVFNPDFILFFVLLYFEKKNGQIVNF